jgi:TrmH family RNA methyltransferase
MEIIRSRQNTLFKHLHKLAENRRERVKTGQTLLIGTHLVQSAQQAAWPIERIVIREGSETAPEIAAILQRRSSPAIWLDPALFDDIEQLPSSTGIMALAAIPQRPTLATTGCCLLLDGVQDPGNVGSILRTAAAAGVDQVWLSHGCADIWSPKVIRAGMGAHFALALLDHVELGSAADGFKGPLAITTLDATQSLYATDLRGDILLALGSEGSGVSAELEARATLRLLIPMAGGVESLNVGAAAAVCLFERRRQGLQAKA